ncbi:MBL fold metallo-hydrolase [Allosphingosinicella deserti]|uniref:MBL fold metallo-hydrolase n=1 Tax=Allosphingosinicella deserti TaxID=2116704 RepID=A0A2P7QEF3_9SPHN|nr:MBL fold metallo-hydrolase [Sphingomonas deserti]PSJ36353.1 MBL fold metallo-hydrolase [Sphingomonas deserti]
MQLRTFTAGLLALAAPAAAQQPDYSKVEIRIEQIAPGVAVLFGAGGNIGLSHGVDGNVIVDDQFAPLTPKILAAIRSLDPDPVRFVVNTHWHFDHTGGNEDHGKAGAVILAHRNVRERMSTEQFLAAMNMKIPPSPKDALPVVTFAEGVDLNLNGDTLHVIHVGNAHTDGDSIVHWQKANVLHMGDTFFHRASFPFIDLSSGGSIDGVIAAAEKGLKMANDETRIIPGHGPIARRTDLAAYRDMLIAIRGKVAAGIAAKRSLTQIQASKPAAAYGMPDGFIKPDAFVEAVYTSLRSPPKGAPHAHGGKTHRH